MKVQIVTPYRVSHLQRYDITVRGNVTSVLPTFREPRVRNFVLVLATTDVIGTAGHSDDTPRERLWNKHVQQGHS
jgi:hypothetical protein